MHVLGRAYARNIQRNWRQKAKIANTHTKEHKTTWNAWEPRDARNEPREIGRFVHAESGMEIYNRIVCERFKAAAQYLARLRDDYMMQL